MGSDFYSLCRRCAEEIYAGPTVPSDEYVDRVVRLLMGTAAQESKFQDRYRRQRARDGSALPADVGGYGLWQVEPSTAAWLIAWARPSRRLTDRCKAFLGRDLAAMTGQQWCELMVEDDAAGVLGARLRYLTVPAPIPVALAEQAAYWLERYNGGGVLKHMTRGAALRQYQNNFAKYAAPLMAGKCPTGQGG